VAPDRPGDRPIIDPGSRECQPGADEDFPHFFYG
jgi:hypothetical protein